MRHAAFSLSPPFQLLSKFAEVSEVSLASPSGSPAPERRGTVGADGAVGEGMLRTGSTASTLSVQSRHFSVATRVRVHDVWLLLLFSCMCVCLVHVCTCTFTIEILAAIYR